MSTKAERNKIKAAQLFKQTTEIPVDVFLKNEVVLNYTRLYHRVRQEIIEAPKPIDTSVYSQLSRAASSIGANFVEGHAKGSASETLRFLKMSYGSAVECIYWAELIDLSFAWEFRDLHLQLRGYIWSFIEAAEFTEE